MSTTQTAATAEPKPRNPGGRPPKADRDKRKPLTIYVEDDLREAIEQAAEESGEDVSAHIRRLLIAARAARLIV